MSLTTRKVIAIQVAIIITWNNNHLERDSAAQHVLFQVHVSQFRELIAIALRPFRWQCADEMVVPQFNSGDAIS